MLKAPSSERRNAEFRSVSIIIPTKNRPDDLEQTVRSVLRQTVLPREVIIVDQGSVSESRRRIERLFTPHTNGDAGRIKLCYLSDTSIPGGAAARNRAMDVAEGDIWLFLDDDVELEPNFLEELLAAYVRCPHTTGVSGIITNYRSPSLLSRLWRGVFLCGPFRDERQAIYWKADRLQQAEPIAVSRLGSGLMSFRAEAIRNLRFDENLRGVSDGEDVDFCMRLKPGTTLVIAPRARLAHKQSPSGRLQDHPLRRDARGLYFLYWKNWNRGIKNRLCFAWLYGGYVLLAMAASLRRRSLAPWRAFRTGVREAHNVVEAKSPRGLLASQGRFGSREGG